MNRNKIAALIVAVSATCIVSAHSKNVYATENKHNQSQLEQNTQSRAVKKGQVINVSTNLRIRKGPGTNHSVIGYLTNGEVFNIDGKNGQWYKINTNGKSGYIHKDYVKELNGNSNSGSNSGSSNNGNSSESSDLDTSLAGKTGKVVNVSSSLRVRQSPSTSSSVIGSLRGGQTFEIKGKSGQWYYVKANGITGYIHGDYVQVVSGGNSGGSTDGNSGGSDSELDTSLAGKKGKVVNVSSSLRIRQSNSTSSAIVGHLNSGQTFNIKGKKGQWHYIDAQGTTGYVHEDYVKVISNDEGGNSGGNNSGGGSQTGDLDESCNGKIGKIVNVSTNLRLRSQPNTSSSVLAYLLPSERVNLKGKTSSGWYKVSHNGKIGYVSSKYVEIVSSSEGGSDNNNSGGEVNQSKYEQVLSIMKAQIGSPYIYGGSGETLTQSLLSTLRNRFLDHANRGFYDISSQYLNGNYRAFDCSGLMQWSFGQAGISLGRTTWDQINNGVEVSPSNAKPGDLLFFSNMGHVGMYIGNGQWIEAPNKGKFVSIASVPWSKIGRARRVL